MSIEYFFLADSFFSWNSCFLMINHAEKSMKLGKSKRSFFLGQSSHLVYVYLQYIYI